MIAVPKLAPTPEASWSDERLVSECLKGKQEAWDALIEKYKNLIYSIPVKLGLHDDAADVFQAVCLDLLKQLKNIREPRALAKWIMQAAYHRCLRVKVQDSREAPPHDDGVEVPSAQALPDALLLQLEREQAVRGAVAALSPRCRDMVQLLFYQDTPRPYAEVAAQLGLATGSVGFIRGRCLSALKKQLQKAGF